MRVFVTGGNGFIGSVVVKILLREGHDVLCFLRKSSDTARIDAYSYQKRFGDVRDIDSVRAGMKGADAVIHLASLSSWDLIDSPEMEDVVVTGTQNVLDVARESGNVRVVYVSSVTAVDGKLEPSVMDENTTYTLGNERGLTYAQYKHRAEGLCKVAAEAGVPVIIVNPTEVYGPNDTSLITSGTLIDFGKSSPVMVCKGGTSIVHVEDVALGIVRAAEKGKLGERYILGGDNLTLKKLASLTLDLMGKKSSVWTLPNGVFKGITKVFGGLHIPLPYNPKVVPYATRYWFVDSSKAQRDLGVTFRSARDTLAPTLNWLREAGHIS